jgi:hypothetical protein
VNLPAAAVEELLKNLGVDMNRTSLITITPRLIEIEAYLRDDKGRFYVDPKQPDRAASETLVFGLEW